MDTPLLDLRSIAFRVGDRTILDGVDLAVAEGELHALVGANGSGKSTLAFLVMGCEGYAPTAGEVRFDGRPLTGLAVHERARMGITLAWQEPARFEGLTVRDYLRASGDGDPAEVLQAVGLAAETYLSRLADRTLSGGQRKRLELASVLARRPRLAVLDEPTAGIDLLSLDDMTALIRSFTRHGSTVLIITHQPEVAAIADVASELAGGRIASSGPPADVLRRYRARRTRIDAVA